MDVSQIIQYFDAFLSGDPENVHEIDQIIISSITDLESLSVFLSIIETYPNNESYLRLAHSAIKRGLHIHWDSSPIESQCSFLIIYNPINYIESPLFYSVLDDFLDLLFDYDYYKEYNKPKEELIEVFNQTIQQIKEKLTETDDDKIIIKLLQFLYYITEIYFQQAEVITSELVSFIVEITDNFIDPSFYYDQVKCCALRFAFSTKYRLFHALVVNNKNGLDFNEEEEVYDQYQAIENSTFELFCQLFVEWINIDEVNESQIDLMLFLCLRLVDISASGLIEEASSKQAQYQLMESIWPCFENALQKCPKNLYFLSQFIRILINSVECFRLSPEQLAQLVSLSQLTQEDVEDFAFQPNVFWENAYSPTNNDEVTSLRNYIATYAEAWSSFAEEEELVELLSSFSLSEHEAYILSQMTNKCAKFDSTRSFILEYAHSYLENAQQTFDQITSLHVMASITFLLDAQTKQSLLANHIELIHSQSIAVLNSFSKFLLKLYTSKPKGEPYIDYIDPSALIQLITDTVSMYQIPDLIETSNIVIVSHPELLQEAAQFMQPLASALQIIMGENGQSNNDNLQMEWSYNGITLLSSIVKAIGDETCPEVLFELFAKELVPSCEPLDAVFSLGFYCIKHNSPLTDAYIERIFEQLNQSHTMRCYSEISARCLIQAVINNPERSESIYNSTLNVIQKLIVSNGDENKYIDEIASFAAVLAIAIQFNPNIDISNIFDIIALLINGDTVLSLYIATELISSIFVQRAVEIDPQFIEFWMQRLENGQLVLYRDLEMNNQSLMQLSTIAPQYGERIANIIKMIHEDPESMLHLGDAFMGDITTINNLCPPTQLFPSETDCDDDEI